MSKGASNFHDGVVRIKRALISVANLHCIDELAKDLIEMGVAITATGGTGDYLRKMNLPCEDLASISSFRALLGGRVKSLHPAVHAAILADRANEDHMNDLKKLGVEPFDLVVGGLYSFESASAGGWTRLAQEAIDIGGPAMIRAAAKNHEWVTVACETDQYILLRQAMHKGKGWVDAEFRRRMAATVFQHVSEYDAMVANVLRGGGLPDSRTLQLEKVRSLRYGENQDQQAALYGTSAPNGFAAGKLVLGKELSYNNLVDADSAFAIVSEFDATSTFAAAVVKHGTPCGASCNFDSMHAACMTAVEADPLSSFGGVIGINGELDQATAEYFTTKFVELIVARSVSDEALRVMKESSRARIFILSGLDQQRSDRIELRSIHGGYLVQGPSNRRTIRRDWRVVSKIKPDENQWADLEFAWKVAKHAKSNAVVAAMNGVTVGVGSGRTSRVDAAEAAVKPIVAQTPRDRKPVAASDGFFPFADGVEVLANAGVSAIIQPGGSVRDNEVIDAANNWSVAMVFTGERRFRH